jgi:arginase
LTRQPIRSRQSIARWQTPSPGDFNTHATTPSGYLGGMALAALVGRDNQHLMRGVKLTPVAEGDVVITDVRDLDPAEGDALRASNVAVLTDVNALLNHPLPAKPLYIHFDTDVVNTDEMPAIRFPAKNGARLDDIIATLRYALQTGNVAGVLFSLWDDSLPGADITRASMLRIVRSVVQALNG